MAQVVLYFFLTLTVFVLTPFDSYFVKLLVTLPSLAYLVSTLNRYKGKYRVGFTIGSIIMLFGLVLEQFWKGYTEASWVSILIFFLSIFLSFLAVVGNALYVLAVGREKEIRIENKKATTTFKDKINEVKMRRESFRTMKLEYKRLRNEGLGRVRAMQIAFVEYELSKLPPEKNSMEFTFLKEVAHERNKHTIN